MQEAQIIHDLTVAQGELGIRLQPFEQGRRQVLAAPLPVGTGVNVVLELFDKKTANGAAAFTEQDRQLVGAAAQFGAEMLKQALAESQASRMLADAVQAALQASQQISESLGSGTPVGLASLPADTEAGPTSPPPAPVMQKLRHGLETTGLAAAEVDGTLELAELIRVLSVRHGSAALRHAIEVLASTDRLLRAVTLDEEGRP
jgi:hypothetical protein